MAMRRTQRDSPSRGAGVKMARKKDRDLEYSALETIGESGVWLAMAEGRLLGPKPSTAYAWLREKEEARRSEAERKSEAFQAEQAATALRAAGAAETAESAASRAATAGDDANRLARRANRMATIALAIAAISLMATIVSPLLHR